MPKEKEQFSLAKDEMREKICINLGGIQAEKNFLGKDKVSTHCTEDLKKATALAYSMVRNYGMEEEKYGLASADKEHLSQSANAKVDEAVHLIMNVKNGVKENRMRLNLRKSY